jgi:hypothetical protein
MIVASLVLIDITSVRTTGEHHRGFDDDLFYATGVMEFVLYCILVCKCLYQMLLWYYMIESFAILYLREPTVLLLEIEH